MPCRTDAMECHGAGAPLPFCGRWRRGVWRVLLLVLLGGAAAPGAGAGGVGDERLTVGLKAFQDGFHSLASKELQSFLAAAPDDPRRAQVLAVLAQAELAQNNWGGARQALEQLRRAGGDAEDALYRLVWVAARQGEGRAAVEYAEEYLSLAGGGRAGEVVEWAAQAAWQAKAFDSAAGLYARFLALVPGDVRRPAIWAGRVAALEQAGAPAQTVLAAVDASLGEGLPEAGLRAVVAEAGVRAARVSSNHRREAELWRVLAEADRDPARQRRARLESGLAAARAGDDVQSETILADVVARYPAGTEAVAARLVLADLARRRGDWKRVLDQLETVLASPEADRVGYQPLELVRGAFAAALAAGDEPSAAAHAGTLLSGGFALSPEEQGSVRLVLGRRAAGSDPKAAIDHWLAVPAGTAPYRDSRLAAAALLTEIGQAREAMAALQPLLDGALADPEVQRVALAAAEGAGQWQRAALLADAMAAALPAGSDQRALVQRAALHWLKAGDAAGYERALVGLTGGGVVDGTARWAAAELQRLAFGRGEWEAAVAWAEQAGAEADGDLGLRHATALERLGRDEAALQVLGAVAARGGPGAGSALARTGAIHDRAQRWAEARESYLAALASGVPPDVAAWLRQRLGELPGGVPETPAALPR